MSAVSSLLTSSNANATDLVGEWMPGILVKQGRSANFGSVLLGFFSKLKAEAALNGEYNSWERAPVRSNFYSNAANATTTSTVLTFDDGSGNAVVALLAAGTILKNGTSGEYVKVAVDPATNLTTTQVQVVRDYFGTQVTGIAVLDNDVWSRVTEGAVEGTAPRRAAYETPSNIYNLIQTFKSTAYLSNYYTAGQVRTNMEGPKADAVAYALEQVVNQIEKAFLFGQRLRGTATTEQFTGGLEWATDAAITAGADSALKLNGLTTTGISFTAFTSWLNSFMLKGSQAKLIMCGNKAYTALSNYANQAASGLRFSKDQEPVLGMNITEIETPLGKASLAMHPLMCNDLNFQDHAIAVDLGLVRMKVMEKLHFQAFEPTNGTDAFQGQFRAKLGLFQQFAEAGGYAYGLQKIIPG